MRHPTPRTAHYSQQQLEEEEEDPIYTAGVADEELDDTRCAPCYGNNPYDSYYPHLHPSLPPAPFSTPTLSPSSSYCYFPPPTFLPHQQHIIYPHFNIDNINNNTATPHNTFSDPTAYVVVTGGDGAPTREERSSQWRRRRKDGLHILRVEEKKMWIDKEVTYRRHPSKLGVLLKKTRTTKHTRTNRTKILGPFLWPPSSSLSSLSSSPSSQNQERFEEISEE